MCNRWWGVEVIRFGPFLHACTDFGNPEVLVGNISNTPVFSTLLVAHMNQRVTCQDTVQSNDMMHISLYNKYNVILFSRKNNETIQCDTMELDMGRITNWSTGNQDRNTGIPSALFASM